MPVSLNTNEPAARPGSDSGTRQLRRAILDGTLQTGARLRGDELTALVGASVTSIQQSLDRLVDEGLAEITPENETRVALRSDSGFRDASRTLGFLFGGVARVTVGACSPVAKAELVRGTENILSGIDERSREGLFAAVLKQYELWLDACPNRMLAATVEQSVPALFYRLRSPQPGQRPIDWCAAGVAVSGLRNALASDDAIEAQQWVEAMHQLPTFAGSPRSV